MGLIGMKVALTREHYEALGAFLGEKAREYAALLGLELLSCEIPKVITFDCTVRKRDAAG